MVMMGSGRVRRRATSAASTVSSGVQMDNGREIGHWGDADREVLDLGERVRTSGLQASGPRY